MDNIEITGLVGEGWILVKEFDVLHHGWECDGTGYLIKNKKGKLVLLLSSHGSFYIAEQKELMGYVDYYMEVVNESKLILDMLEGDL